MPYERDMFGAEAWTSNGYRAELADPRRGTTWPPRPDGALLGWAGVMVVARRPRSSPSGVVPAARGAGHRRRLMAELLAEAAPRGRPRCSSRCGSTTPAPRALYERGFRRDRPPRGYYDGGRVDAVVMRREL